MLKHTIKMLIRKQPGFTALNFAGLIIGMTACLLLFKYIRYEQAYDRQSPHAGQIWRVFNKTMNGETAITLDANTHSAVGPTLKAEVPAVADFFRLYNGGSSEVVVLVNQQPFELQHFFCTDPGFLRMMPQTPLYGHLPAGLDAPYQGILTESTAKRLFGVSNVVGKTLRIASGMCEGEYTISAVVADPPQNTHLKFELLTSYATRYAKGHQDNFESYWDYNYIQLHPGSSIDGVQQKLAAINEQFLKQDGIQLDVQRFTDIHLKSDLTYEIEPNGSARMVQFLGILALFVLCIALINYTNLATALAEERAKEVAVRKAVGAGRGQLVGQFLGESALMSLAAFGVAAFICQQTLPWFGTLIGRPLATENQSADPVYWGVSLGAALAAAVLAGLYPALRLSQLKPVNALYGRYFGSGSSLRHALVVLQFMFSAGLIFGLLVVGRQLHFLREHELGIQLDQMVTIKAAAGPAYRDSLGRQKLAALKNECAALSGVSGLTASSIVPGLGINSISGSNRPIRWTQKPDYARITSYFVETDEQFFQTFGVKLLAGEIRLLTDRAARYRSVAINKAMLDALGFPSAEAAVGQTMAYENSENGATMSICAVVDNFHIESLKNTPKPTLYYCFPPEELNYLSVRIDPKGMEAALAGLQTAWSNIYPDQPFRYWFLDDHFANQYRSEQQFGRVFGLFTVLSVIVSCLGLLGLAAYSTRRRRKEIGIRKVLGASAGSIAGLLTRDFLKWVMLAVVLAAPIGWWAMQHWLADFAYRIELKGWMFVAAGAFAVCIALLTVSLQSLRAAWSNPVKSLRSE